MIGSGLGSCLPHPRAIPAHLVIAPAPCLSLGLVVKHPAALRISADLDSGNTAVGQNLRERPRRLRQNFVPAGTRRHKLKLKPILALAQSSCPGYIQRLIQRPHICLSERFLSRHTLANRPHHCSKGRPSGRRKLPALRPRESPAAQKKGQPSRVLEVVSGMAEGVPLLAVHQVEPRAALAVAMRYEILV